MTVVPTIPSTNDIEEAIPIGRAVAAIAHRLAVACGAPKELQDELLEMSRGGETAR